MVRQGKRVERGCKEERREGVRKGGMEGKRKEKERKKERRGGIEVPPSAFCPIAWPADIHSIPCSKRCRCH